MLSAQQKDFDEKGSSNYPCEFARWYQLDYFQRPRALKTCRFYITVIATIVAVGFSLQTIAFESQHDVHQAALVSKAHAGFNRQCTNCHDQTWQPLTRLLGGHNAHSVSDASCNSCHHGPIHHHAQLEQPACVTCHREHQSKENLATHVADRHCTSCHANLEQHVLPWNTAFFHKTITNFNIDHPEFKPSLPGVQDETKLRFTHVDHMKLDLAALRKQNPHLEKKYTNKSSLECADCHRVAAQRRYMLPIKYDEHCAVCHQLTVTLVGDFADAALQQAAAVFRRQPAPHQEPAVVRAVLRDRFVQFAQVNKLKPADTKTNDPRPLPWRKPPNIDAPTWTWATGQGQKNESLLFANQQWQKGHGLQFTQCSHCHLEAKASPRADGLPVYEPTKIPPRWYRHSVFNHDSHRMMRCDQCHDQAASSQKTADILLPKLHLCQKCHKQGGLARNDCVECHQYHDHQLEREHNGRFTLDALLPKR